MFKLYQYNEDGSKVFIQDCISLADCFAAIALLDQSNSFSIEKWNNGMATILQ